MDINFKSFSISPSDHECQQGDLASVQNLVYEDGALKPIPLPSHIASVPNSPAVNDTEYYIHEVDTDSLTDSDNINYIAISSGESGNHVYWCNNIQNGAIAWTKIDDLDDFKVNAVTFTGRIINFIGDTEQRWAVWGDGNYSVITKDDFDYSLVVESRKFDDGISSTDDDVFAAPFPLCSEVMDSYKDSENRTWYYRFHKEGIAAITDALDAAISKLIAGYPNTNKHISFGVAAVRMYDGSYFALSNIFTVGGAYNMNGFTWISYGSAAGKTYDAPFVMTKSCLHNDFVKATFNHLEKIRYLIQSVDIFLTAPSLFANVEKAYEFTPFRFDTGEVKTILISYDKLSESELYKHIDNMSFHKVASLTYEDMTSSGYASGSGVALRTVDETDSAISLADWGTARMGANCATNYNGRLLIADYTKSLNMQPNADIRYRFKNYDTGIDTSTITSVKWNWGYLPAQVDTNNCKLLMRAEIYYAVHYTTDHNASRTTYLHNTATFPIPPIVSFPMTGITSVDMYIHYTGAGTAYFYKEGIKVHTSETGNWSYIPFVNGSSPVFASNVRWENNNWVDDSTFFDIDTNGTKFNAAAEAFDDAKKYIITRFRNQILSSDADNPFLFRDSATISVGNGSVLALAAPTQPISQGQAGQTPLVAFTSEGIYPLYVGNDGSLVATQPGPRDVLINSKAVLPIDDAIVFATSRGLMLYAGSKTQCITDSLRGKVFDGIVPYLSAVMSSNGTTYTSNKIGSYAPLANLESFLSDCRLMYNYIDQQLLAFLPDVAKVLVYSLRSGAWGAADYDYRKPLNSYPDALAIGYKNGAYELVNVHNGSTTDSIPVSLVSRPISLGEPDTLKRISSAIFRGYFAKGHVKSAVYGSRDLLHWQLINTSVDHILRNRMGSPYKYFRFAALGNLSHDESVYGVSVDASPSMANQLR